MPSFIIIGYVQQILGSGGFFAPPPPIREQQKKNPFRIVLRVRRTDEIWVSMKTARDVLGIKNISDLVLKEIYGKYERKTLTDKEI